MYKFGWMITSTSNFWLFLSRTTLIWDKRMNKYPRGWQKTSHQTFLTYVLPVCVCLMHLKTPRIGISCFGQPFQTSSLNGSPSFWKQYSSRMLRSNPTRVSIKLMLKCYYKKFTQELNTFRILPEVAVDGQSCLAIVHVNRSLWVRFGVDSDEQCTITAWHEPSGDLFSETNQSILASIL